MTLRALLAHVRYRTLRRLSPLIRTIHFLERFVLSSNALIPLNDDGLRASAIPTVELEYLFSLPN